MTTPANESETQTGDEIVFSNYENLRAEAAKKKAAEKK